MEFIAIAKSVRIAPRKIRLVADAIRKQKSLGKSLDALTLMNKRASNPVAKTLESAIANAVNRGAKKEELFLKSIEIMEGTAIKRYRPSTRGRVHPYKKRSSHIKIILADNLTQNSKGKTQNLITKGASHGTKS
ncbi:MAG: 50S ribosomal protein L22 [Patescibacteria group bacterium]